MRKGTSTVIMVLIYGAIVFLISVKLLNIANRGNFARWQSLGKPPESVQELLDIEPLRTTHEVDVYVKTDSSNIYVRKHDQGKWEVHNSYKAVDPFLCHELSVGIDRYPYFSNLPGGVVDCQMIAWSSEWVRDNTYVVLLDDNSIWQWNQRDLNNVYTFLCGGPVVGLVIGLIVVRAVLYRRKLGK